MQALEQLKNLLVVKAGSSDKPCDPGVFHLQIYARDSAISLKKSRQGTRPRFRSLYNEGQYARPVDPVPTRKDNIGGF